MTNSILVTGGMGFIGSNFVLQWLAHETGAVANLDSLTYAGNPLNLASVEHHSAYRFVRGNIRDHRLVAELLRIHRPRAIVHFAAESHVDRSIEAPEEFIQTNVLGTFQLLHAARDYWTELCGDERDHFRFVHISTDEVYGTLASSDSAFSESTAYAPSSPYSASKAGSDHLVRSYHRTYGLPTLIINCSNNYGPRQFPEKLIPLMIISALHGKHLPIYGDGSNVRDWLYVEDHCSAIRAVLAKGRPGETYNVGGRSEMTNLEVVRAICATLQVERPGRNYASLVIFVKDRPGHDERYAIDCTKIETELGWRASETFATGIAKTVRWYLDNPEWIANVTSGEYQKWINTNRAER